MNSKGLSLIEILISLALLALAGTFIATNVFKRYEEGRRNAATIQMQNIAGALQEFRRYCDQYPAEEQGGLEALIHKPSGGKECKRYPPNGILEGGQVPVDPWDNPYEYKSDGKTFTLKSYGKDGMPGGEGDDADIEYNPQQAKSQPPAQ